MLLLNISDLQFMSWNQTDFFLHIFVVKKDKMKKPSISSLWPNIIGLWKEQPRSIDIYT
jgi:hypothetical protein